MKTCGLFIFLFLLNETLFPWWPRLPAPLFFPFLRVLLGPLTGQVTGTLVFFLLTSTLPQVFFPPFCFLKLSPGILGPLLTPPPLPPIVASVTPLLFPSLWREVYPPFSFPRYWLRCELSVFSDSWES